MLILIAMHLFLYIFHVLKSLRLKNVANYFFSFVYILKMVIMGNISYLPTICHSTTHFIYVFSFKSYNCFTIITILQIKGLKFREINLLKPTHKGTFAAEYLILCSSSCHIILISAQAHYTQDTVINILSVNQ